MKGASKPHSDRQPVSEDFRQARVWINDVLEDEWQEYEDGSREPTTAGARLLSALSAIDSIEEQFESAVGLAKALAMGKFATPHPDGAFGLAPNTWEVPPFVQTMALDTLHRVDVEPNPASRPNA